MKLQKQSEMQDFFDALGIDENIFEQMAETFTSNFMIEGKTTTDLNAGWRSGRKAHRRYFVFVFQFSSE